jgi:hypothetical protein
MKYRENQLIFEQYRKVLKESNGMSEKYEFEVDEIPGMAGGPFYVEGTVEYSTYPDVGGGGESLNVPEWENGSIDRVYYFDESDDPQEVDVTGQITPEVEKFLLSELKDQFENDQDIY